MSGERPTERTQEMESERERDFFLTSRSQFASITVAGPISTFTFIFPAKNIKQLFLGGSSMIDYILQTGVKLAS